MSNTTSPSTMTDTTVPSAAGCCGGAAPEGTGACCARDAEVKATGGSGCGCSAQASPAPTAARSGCCG
jgi:hypothetical protein